MSLFDYAKKKKDQVANYFKPTENVRVRDFVREVPGTIANMFEGTKNVVTKAPKILGEGAAYALDRNVRDQYKAGNTNILPTVSSTSPKSMLADTAKAVFELAPVTAIKPLAKFAMSSKLAPRVAAGTGMGYGYDVSSNLAKEKQVEKKDFVPGMGTVTGGFFAGVSKPATIMAREGIDQAKRTAQKTKSIVSQIPEATKNSLRNRGVGKPLPTESIPAHYAKGKRVPVGQQDNLPKIFPQLSEKTRFSGKVRPEKIDPVTQAPRFSIGTEKFLPEQTVTRKATPTLSDLGREIRGALPRPGMSIEDVSARNLKRGKSKAYKVMTGQSSTKKVAELTPKVQEQTQLPKDINATSEFFKKTNSVHPKERPLQFVDTLHNPDSIVHFPSEKRLNFFDESGKGYAVGTRDIGGGYGSHQSVTQFTPRNKNYIENKKKTGIPVFSKRSGGAAMPSSSPIESAPPAVQHPSSGFSGVGTFAPSIAPKGGKVNTAFSSRVTPESRTNPASYNPVTQQEILTKAKGNLQLGYEFALKQARNEKLGAEANATAMGLIDDAIKNEKWDSLDMLLKEFAPRFSKQGQEINILNRWGRLTPAGAVRYTQHIINKAVDATKKQIEFTPQAKQEIVALAEEVQKVTPGTREQTVAIAKLFGKIQEQIPTSFLRKVSTIQTMAQLLNPKTAIRNVIGNAGFAVGEAVSDAVATPIDIATSLFTGKRTKTLPSLTTLGKGFGKGFREGAEEAGLGIDTKGLPGQFDLPTAPTFKGKVGGFFEKGLAYELKATDRAFYQAAYDDSLRQQMKLAKTKTPTPEMQEIAHDDGLYRTFQDDSKAAWLFQKIKQGLNLGQDWGLGDIVLKYPKTPGNLLSRAIEYSPAGYGKAVIDIVKPLVTGTPFNQKSFVEALSRGSVGSAGLVGAGFILSKLGILTGEPSSDKDINALERSEGGGPYRFNVSAAKRLMFGGDAQEKDGDVMVSYDWLQPFAVPISIGVNAQKDGATLSGSKNVALESMTSGINTLAEQPLMQGVKKMFGYGDIAGGIADVSASAPASFVPTFINQIRQFTDNTTRETRGGSLINRALSSTQAKIPRLASGLPPQYNTLGEERETYQNGSNTLFNVFFNPAFVSQLESTPSGKEVMEIYQGSGETQQFPRVAPKTVEINNGESKEKLQLSNEQLSEYQKYIGERTKATFDKLAGDQRFQSLSDEEKAKYMADALSDINTAAKIELFGHKTSNAYVKGAAPYMNGTPGYETNETALSKQKLLLYKQRKDTESWMKEADSLHKQYEKALEDKNLPEIDRVRITKDMEMLAGQLNKYKSYGGFTKPKKAKKISVASQDDAQFIVKNMSSKLRPLRAFGRSRTNLASVSRPNIRRPKRLS